MSAEALAPHAGEEAQHQARHDAACRQKLRAIRRLDEAAARLARQSGLYMEQRAEATGRLITTIRRAPDEHGLDEDVQRIIADPVTTAARAALAMKCAARRLRKELDCMQADIVKKRREAARKRLDAGSAPGSAVYRALREYVPSALAFLYVRGHLVCDGVQIEYAVRTAWDAIFPQR